ncbi:MAG: ATP-binding protein [Lachnospiraceae bacterium]|nr:ATP-binding protein [Lachnospiraceae bacterium]
MLKMFKVTNFKNFKDTMVFDLGNHSNYEFNNEIITGNCLTKGIIYGINGSGKSNLALALFDIVLHLTDKEKSLDKYTLYLNLDSKKPTADFEYLFEFNGTEVLYRYSKSDALTLASESLIIDGNEVLSYDFATKKGYTNLKGAETLQLSSEIPTESDKLSRVKVIKGNALLQDTKENRAFIDFVSFVDNMLMFYSLDQNRYQGFSVGIDSYTQGIIREGKIKEFEDFLRLQGVDYELTEGLFNGIPEMFCKFENGTVPFTLVASTGTRSLALFYYWYIKMIKASFVFVDEYDAFYHFELSQSLVELVKKLSNVQVFFSTHNTDLLSNDLLRPDAFFRIKNNKITSFDKITSKELRKAHNIQKMYKAGSFDE